MPDIVRYEDVEPAAKGMSFLPMGIAKKTLNPMGVNLENRVVVPVVAGEISQTVFFVREWMKVLTSACTTVCVDAERLLNTDDVIGAECVQDNFEEFINDLFNQAVERNNTYKDAKMDPASLDAFERKVIVLMGYKRLFNRLTPDGQEKLSLILSKTESAYKLHFVIVEGVSELNSFNYEEWFKKHLKGDEGVWIGDGVADQYLLKISKVTSELYAEIGDAYGYVLNRNRPTLVKLLSAAEEGTE